MAVQSCEVEKVREEMEKMGAVGVEAGEVAVMQLEGVELGREQRRVGLRSEKRLGGEKVGLGSSDLQGVESSHLLPEKKEQHCPSLSVSSASS